MMLAVAAQASACEIQGEKDGGPNPVHCPSAVKNYVVRNAICVHFSGEFAGNRSERDAEVNREMIKYKCDALDAEKIRLTKRYAENPAIMQVLATAPNE